MKLLVERAKAAEAWWSLVHVDKSSLAHHPRRAPLATHLTIIAAVVVAIVAAHFEYPGLLCEVAGLALGAAYTGLYTIQCEVAGALSSAFGPAFACTIAEASPWDSWVPWRLNWPLRQRQQLPPSATGPYMWVDCCSLPGSHSSGSL